MADPAVHDQTITLNGLRLHYRDWGDPQNPPVLLLHGAAMHARTWDHFAAATTDQFRLLALDTRGHGESDRSTDYGFERIISDIEEFADRLRLDRFTLIGNSMGGRHAGLYAARHPTRVEHLVIVESCLNPPLTADAQSVLAYFQGLPASFASLDQALTTYRPLAPRAPDDMLRPWVTDALCDDGDGRLIWRRDPLVRTQNINPSWEFTRSLLPDVTCPTLLVCGVDSFTRADTEATAPLMQRAHAGLVPGAGHFPMLDNPAGFLELVRPFLLEN
jgi:pimeloyl-ACP methyl ester carboxylesterase